MTPYDDYCGDCAWMLFLEPLRSARCASHNKLHIRSHKRYYSPLTGKDNSRKLRSQSAHCANSAKNCTRNVLVSRHQQTHHSAWFSKHTTRLRIHSCACLKHSNFLNTDRLRKSGLSTDCSHETLLLFGLQQLSQGRVKQFLNREIVRQGINVVINLVEHLCLLGSTNSIPINPGLMSYSHMPSRPYVTRQ